VLTHLDGYIMLNAQVYGLGLEAQTGQRAPFDHLDVAYLRVAAAGKRARELVKIYLEEDLVWDRPTIGLDAVLGEDDGTLDLHEDTGRFRL